MGLLEDLKKSLLNFSFIMIYRIHKILVLIKNHLNYLKDNIFECFFKKHNGLLFKTKKKQKTKLKIQGLKKKKTIKDVRNIFRLKKELNHTAIKDIRNCFRRN